MKSQHFARHFIAFTSPFLANSITWLHTPLPRLFRLFSINMVDTARLNGLRGGNHSAAIRLINRINNILADATLSRTQKIHKLQSKITALDANLTTSVYHVSFSLPEMSSTASHQSTQRVTTGMDPEPNNSRNFRPGSMSEISISLKIS
jgi:hypothetical protein